MAWTVYVHKFPNKKNYVGITSRPVNKRWGYNGVGYKKQVVYNAIKKYGWNNGVKRTNIGNCLTGKTQRAGGYIWKYKNPDTIITPKISKIEQYSLSGEFIQKYNSLSEASNTTNCDVAAIRRCCRGEVKSCGNFIWKYEQIF